MIGEHVGRLDRLLARAFVALLVLWGWPAGATARPVDLELVLAVDTSLSVSSEEFELQVRGLARAFRDPRVIGAIRAAGDLGVAVSLVQWANHGEQSVVIDWTLLRSTESALVLSRRIERMPRRFAGYGTSIYSALYFCSRLFFENDFWGRRRVIDVSGDGSDNRGPMPDLMRDRLISAGITINGLAIRNEEPGLDFYYEWHVIGGTGAFVMVAADYQDFADAIVHKLVREIAGAPLAGVPWRPPAVRLAALP